MLLLNQFGYDCNGTLVLDSFTTNITEIIDVYGLCKVGSPIYFDLTGRKVNDKGDLAPGIYIVVQKWSNGNITTQKVFLNSWSQ